MENNSYLPDHHMKVIKAAFIIISHSVQLENILQGWNCLFRINLHYPSSKLELFSHFLFSPTQHHREGGLGRWKEIFTKIIMVCDTTAFSTLQLSSKNRITLIPGMCAIKKSVVLLFHASYPRMDTIFRFGGSISMKPTLLDILLRHIISLWDCLVRDAIHVVIFVLIFPFFALSLKSRQHFPCKFSPVMWKSLRTASFLVSGVSNLVVCMHDLVGKTKQVTTQICDMMVWYVMLKRLEKTSKKKTFQTLFPRGTRAETNSKVYFACHTWREIM